MDLHPQDVEELKTINFDGFSQLITRVDAGSVGTVYRYRTRGRRPDIAVKVPHSKVYVPNLIREQRNNDLIWHLAEEHGLVDEAKKYFQKVESLERGDTIILLSEYYQSNLSVLLTGGSLSSWWSSLEKERKLKCLQQIAVQLLFGIDLLDKLGVEHRDICIENIMFDQNRNIKFIDFGLLVFTDSPFKHAPYWSLPKDSYAAPDFMELQVDHLNSVFSVGCILGELFLNREEDLYLFRGELPDVGSVFDVQGELLLAGIHHGGEWRVFSEMVDHMLEPRDKRPTALQLIEEYFPSHLPQKKRVTTSEKQIIQPILANAQPVDSEDALSAASTPEKPITPQLRSPAKSTTKSWAALFS